MLSQAAAEVHEEAERRYHTIISWHTLGETGLFFGRHDKWQTTDDEGVGLRNVQHLCNPSVK